MRNKLAKMLAILGTVAALSVLVTGFISSDVRSVERKEPIGYSTTPSYSVAPGGMGDILRGG